MPPATTAATTPAIAAATAALNAAITGSGAGNAALTNLPRKINIGLSSSRDDFAHCHINDVGLKVRCCAARGGDSGGRQGGVGHASAASGGRRMTEPPPTFSGGGRVSSVMCDGCNRLYPPKMRRCCCCFCCCSLSQAVRDPGSGEVGFNVELGGYFSIKRNVMSIRCSWSGGRGGIPLDVPACWPAGLPAPSHAPYSSLHPLIPPTHPPDTLLQRRHLSVCRPGGALLPGAAGSVQVRFVAGGWAGGQARCTSDGDLSRLPCL